MPRCSEQYYNWRVFRIPDSKERTGEDRIRQPRNMVTQATHTLICRCPKWDLAMLSDTWQSHGSVQKHRHIVHNTTDSVTDLEAPAALWLRMNVLTGTDCLPPEVPFWIPHRQRDERLFGAELSVKSKGLIQSVATITGMENFILNLVTRVIQFMCSMCKCHNLFRITWLSPDCRHED